MKSVLKAPIAGLLALLSRAILRKYRPQIIMITGSVGKTSTKDAVAAMLSEHTNMRASEKSYNSEFGVPFTIMGVKNPWTSLFAWVDVFAEALTLLFFPAHYPKVLVLEVGADRPGDLARILRIATPDAVVVTRLPDVPVHVEAYATPAAVREEEFAPAYALASGAPLILSSRDTYAITMAANTQATVTLFGFSPEADVRIGEPTVMLEDGMPVGMEATATVRGHEYTLYARGALGRPQILAPAAAFAAALALDIPTEEALGGLATYVPPAGRGRLLRGTDRSVLIDESYNSSPAATEEALLALSLLTNAKRRIAVLGDMLELGRYSKFEHERIGTLAASQADMIVAVGSRSKATCTAAVAAGLDASQVRCFENARDAAHALQDEIREGDAILIKGSQSMRMERIVEALLGDPTDAVYLVRQDTEWKKKK
ncbi:MAG: UDP-N-acetylmuramoyl-tripeptide--D-alanyl-D-alanine ligase [Parcubacteria group bacterium]|nr:UDP-N-acetylmuramoyl-tripeptide--D-alanyl-D-alanine ligase [Parcubacteria group bacterium]